MELDHIFLMTDQTRPEEAGLFAAHGLQEAYRRVHPGQGTRNICYAFPDLFLEQLWVDDPVAAGTDAIRATHLASRARWRDTGACPIGVAWRGEGSIGLPWAFRPPYLPEGKAIEVVGEDPRQPMLFTFPGTNAPRHWPAERQGGLQAHLGLGAMQRVRLSVPRGFEPGAPLLALMDRTGLELAVGSGWGLDLGFEAGQLQFRLDSPH